jgi:hypothetical protein
VGGAINACPLRLTRNSAYPFVSADAPSGSCTSRGLASPAPRTLTPLVARAAHWKGLNRDVPTSDVLCRLTGTTRRLQAVSPLPPHVLQRASDSPVRPGPPRTRPVKGESPTTQDAFYRAERSLRHFTYGATQPCASFREEFLRLTRAPIRRHFHHRPRQFQRASPSFRSGDFVLTRSRLVGSSCDSPRCVIEMHPADICFPTLCSTSTRIRPLPDSSPGLAPCVRQKGCAPLDRGIERFHDARIASWIAGLAGEFWSRFPRRPVRSLSTLEFATDSDTPVASLATCAFGDFSQSCAR